MSNKRWFAALLLLTATLVSSSAQADQGLEHDDILITSNKHFDKAHGVRSGRGTTRDPYVISDWDVHSLTILNTSKAVRIVDSTIQNLTLNYAGRFFDVRRNEIGDLRVNENVPRTGAPTSGMFMDNTIGVVGQIRHFDGRFAHNTVGTKPGPFDLGTPLAVNFDGFNGAMFDHNTIFGLVDVRLHGHHHSSGFGAGSHMHNAHHEHDMVDHTKRFHEVTVAKNTIYSNGSYGLAFIDTNHEGNDRTADSETNEELNLPHVHSTRVAFDANKLVGAGIIVDVFNAVDSLHKRYSTGSLAITRNQIALGQEQGPLFFGRNGIQIQSARALVVRMASNTITAPKPGPQIPLFRDWTYGGDGVALNGLNAANVIIEDLAVSNVRYGINATSMTSTVRWSVTRLRAAGVDRAIQYDSTVSNEPRVTE